MNRSQDKRTLLLFGSLVLVTALVYWPGLGGGFILDDFPNLNLLALLPEETNLRQILNLSGNGIASDLGRPLSMFSFLLQAEAWPDQPSSFKLVNVVLHLVNGGLLVLFCRQSGRADSRLALRPLILIAVTAFWLLHPVHVSSVLYVVQRMNLLASLFILLGLVTYLWSRNEYAKSGNLPYLLVMIAAPLLFSLLGLLSKENGVLLYLYLWVLEFTVLNRSHHSAGLDRARRLAIFFPLTLGLLAFVIYLPGALETYAQKPFSMWERSLSQFPVLLSYLSVILLPYPDRFGLFHDSFPVYSSLAAVVPAISVLTVLCLLAAAIRYRKLYPIAAFAVLWFFAGHALESTVLPLELYFEHRNYLPSFGILFGLGWGLQNLSERLTGMQQNLIRIAAGVALCWMALVTLLESVLWGDSLAQAYTELERRPSSYRARSYLVQALTSSGNPEQAYEIQQQIMGSGSARLSDYVRWLEFACILRDVEFPEADKLQFAASTAAMDYAVIGQLNNLIPAVLNGVCPAALLPPLVNTVETLLVNENFEASWPDLLYARATVYYAEGDIGQAAILAARSFSLRPDVSVGLMRLNWLTELPDLAQAREFLRTFESEFEFQINSRQGLATQLSLIRDRLD